MPSGNEHHQFTRRSLIIINLELLNNFFFDKFND